MGYTARIAVPSIMGKPGYLDTEFFLSDAFSTHVTHMERSIIPI